MPGPANKRSVNADTAVKKICAAAVIFLSTVCAAAVSAEIQKVSTDELERRLDASLVERGELANSVDCPDELDKKKGAQVECAAVFLGLEQILTVTFNGIDGDLINVQVTERPRRVTPYGLANLLKTFLDELGMPADSIDCPDALNADKGSQVECAVVRNGLGYTATATSNGANGNTVDVNYVVPEKPSWWPRDGLSGHIQAVLKEHRGISPDSADCPDKLDIDDGSEVECTFVIDGLELTATLTSNGGKIDLLTAENPNRLTQEGLVKRVTQAVAEVTGQSPGKVECPEEGLTAEVGEIQRCVVSTGADEFGVTVRVTGVEGGAVNYDITRSK